MWSFGYLWTPLFEGGDDDRDVRNQYVGHDRHKGPAQIRIRPELAGLVGPWDSVFPA